MKVKNKNLKSQAKDLSDDELKRLETLLDIMCLLRDKKYGCAWDIKQDFESIAPYTIEEAYEVADTITEKDFNSLKSELGDLLLQIVFHSQMAKEQNLFDIGDVIYSINKKLIKRHPHIFENNKNELSDKEVKIQWEKIKNDERNSLNSINKSSLDGITKNLPTLIKSQKLQTTASNYGFDWENTNDSINNLIEEIAELKEAIDSHKIENIKDECGDLLFSSINVIRKLNFNADTLLNDTNKKFIKRYKMAERIAANNGKDFSLINLDEKQFYWEQSKKRLKED